jgi:hypothetical protein
MLYSNNFGVDRPTSAAAGLGLLAAGRFRIRARLKPRLYVATETYSQGQFGAKPRRAV